MEKFKICPGCKRRNPTGALECEYCETDLSTVRPMDEETLRAAEEAAAGEEAEKEAEAGAAGEAVRICEECGCQNRPNARKCRQCRADISDIMPIRVQGKKETRYLLTSLDGEYAFSIPEGKTVIGREGAMKEYLEKKSFVSRRHAELRLEKGAAFLLNLSRTNYTYLNNQRTGEEPAELKDGDLIGLGGNEQDGKRQEEAAYFLMRIGTCG